MHANQWKIAFADEGLVSTIELTKFMTSIEHVESPVLLTYFSVACRV